MELAIISFLVCLFSTISVMAVEFIADRRLSIEKERLEIIMLANDTQKKIIQNKGDIHPEARNKIIELKKKVDLIAA